MPAKTGKKKETRKHRATRKEASAPPSLPVGTAKMSQAETKPKESAAEIEGETPQNQEQSSPIDLTKTEAQPETETVKTLQTPAQSIAEEAGEASPKVNDERESSAPQDLRKPPAWHTESETKAEAAKETPIEPATIGEKPKEQETEPQEQKAKLPKKRLAIGFIALLVIFLLLLLAVVIAINIITTKEEFVSPVPEGTSVFSAQIALQETPKSKEVIGFLPYWNIKEETNFRYQLLTQVAFFSLQIDADGNIKKLNEDGTEEPGWTAFKGPSFGTIFRKAKESGAKVILTIQVMDQETISEVVNDPLKRNRTIDQTLEAMLTKNLDGVNIDFEYAGAPSVNTVHNFTEFVKEFEAELQAKKPNATLTVDVFADAIAKVRLWDIPGFVEDVDHIIIMAYDFHRASSSVAAPVAPIRGAPEYWEYDIGKALTEFTKIVPMEKIILGVPYYGYEWRTTADTPYATTYPKSGSLATFKRIQTIIEEKNPKLDWDETALAPRVTYTEKGEIYQIYYENETSLGLKYDLVNQSGIAGIGIWALGYDGKYPNLWNLLAEKLPRN